jgi:hypothetical protein
MIGVLFSHVMKEINLLRAAFVKIEVTEEGQNREEMKKIAINFFSNVVHDVKLHGRPSAFIWQGRVYVIRQAAKS